MMSEISLSTSSRIWCMFGRRVVCSIAQHRLGSSLVWSAIGLWMVVLTGGDLSSALVAYVAMVYFWAVVPKVSWMQTKYWTAVGCWSVVVEWVSLCWRGRAGEGKVARVLMGSAMRYPACGRVIRCDLCEVVWKSHQAFLL